MKAVALPETGGKLKMVTMQSMHRYGHTAGRIGLSLSFCPSLRLNPAKKRPDSRGPKRSVILLLFTAVVAGLVTGCAHTQRVSAAKRASIYERATIRFDQTVLVKPAESDRPEFQMAPLIVQRVVSTNHPPQSPYTVYFWRTFARFNDQVLIQFNYLWFHPEARQSAKTPQGVRITMGGDGRPILWEILRDPSGARILFVSQSLEASAMTNFPSPLPGRRFWIEQPVSQDPEVVVARIIDDSATPMGPILYLESNSYDVSTLICRCMDAQAEEVVGVGIYGLALLDDAAVRWLSRDKTPGITRWLPGRPADQLEKWLRVGDQ